MVFSDGTVEQAWNRAGGRCECTRRRHQHYAGRCHTQLVFKNRGRAGSGAWEAHHRSMSGGDTPSNCEILCWDCHKQTFL